MTGPKFTPQISLGNLLQLAGLLVAGGIAFAVMRGDVAANDERSRGNTAELVAMRERLARVETNEARTDTRLQSIERGQARIEATVNEIARFLREDRP